MSVLITGSIAYDAVFSFAGAFGEQITRPVEPGFNTTFLTRAMRRDFGGCAGNIAVAMKRMGGEPLIWGAVGRDGGDYLEHFGREGIRTDGIGVFSNAYTAQCLIITDHTGAQIAAFHPGAAERTPEVRWPTDADGKEAQPAIAILSPGGRETTLFAAQACRAREIPYFFDVVRSFRSFRLKNSLTLRTMPSGSSIQTLRQRLLSKKPNKVMPTSPRADSSSSVRSEAAAHESGSPASVMRLSYQPCRFKRFAALSERETPSAAAFFMHLSAVFHPLKPRNGGL